MEMSIIYLDFIWIRFTMVRRHVVPNDFAQFIARTSDHPAASPPPPRICCPPPPPLPFRCPFDPRFASDRRRLARRPTPNKWPRQPEPSAGRGVAL